MERSHAADSVPGEGLERGLAFALVAVVGNLGLLNDPRVLSALGLGLAGYAVVFWLVVHGRIIGAVLEWLHQTPMRKLAGPLQEMNAAVRSYGATPQVWTPAIALSIAFYLLVVANAWIGCHAFGLAAPISSLFLIIPVVMSVMAKHVVMPVVSVVPMSSLRFRRAKGKRDQHNAE